MEQARLFAAIALSFIIFLAWDYFFVSHDQEPVAPTQQTTAQDESTPASGEIVDATPAIVPMADEVSVKGSEGKGPSRSITVKTEHFTAVLDERGAALRSMKLHGYSENVHDPDTPKEVVSPSLAAGVFTVGLEKNSLPGLNNALFRSASDEMVDATASEQTLSFVWKSEKGVVLEKRYRFHPQNYLVEMTVTITNQGSDVIKDALYLSLSDEASKETNRYGFTGPSTLIGGKLQQIEADDLEDKNQWTGDMQWAALSRNYFMIAAVPEDTGEESLVVTMKDDIFDCRVVSAETTLASGESRQFRYQLFAGPKSTSLLEATGYELAQVIDFGWFDIIAKPCLWLMNFFYSIIPNYGVAIILLTILTKIVLWPLGTKSYKSMNEMKKIQPLMGELKEKYKDDKKKMNEELMKLYRVYKINPMGGCLPMVVQIPVFIALYRMLYEAIELRHAKFLWWINDLSAPDRLGNFDFSIPFMEAPYGIPILTVIMGATMFLQQKMSPPPGDPTQAKMMMFLPIVFTVIFINFPAGLVLYWLVNNTMSIAQQYFIQKRHS